MAEPFRKNDRWYIRYKDAHGRRATSRAAAVHCGDGHHTESHRGT